jgi:hypothetical protein
VLVSICGQEAKTKSRQHTLGIYHPSPGRCRADRVPWMFDGTQVTNCPRLPSRETSWKHPKSCCCWPVVFFTCLVS